MGIRLYRMGVRPCKTGRTGSRLLHRPNQTNNSPHEQTAHPPYHLYHREWAVVRANMKCSRLLRYSRTKIIACRGTIAHLLCLLRHSSNSTQDHRSRTHRPGLPLLDLPIKELRLKGRIKSDRRLLCLLTIHDVLRASLHKISHHTMARPRQYSSHNGSNNTLHHINNT